MYVNTNKSKLKDGNSFISTRSELATLLAVTESTARLATQGVTLNDEVVFKDGRFNLSWIDSRNGSVLGVTQAHELEGSIFEGLTHCQARRSEATKNNQAIHELPTDAKLLILNKSLFEARQKECSLHLSDNPDATPFPTLNPVELLLQSPKPELQELDVDCIVSGSNVVSGVVQLDLLEETMVDVVYFIRGAQCSQVRAAVPLRLSNVRNLVTRIRTSCTYRAGDSVLQAVGQPHLYDVEDGQEIPL